MTFKQHLEQAIKEQEAQHERRKAGQARHILLPLRDSLAIQHLIREIRLAGGEQPLE